MNIIMSFICVCNLSYQSTWLLLPGRKESIDGFHGSLLSWTNHQYHSCIYSGLIDYYFWGSTLHPISSLPTYSLPITSFQNLFHLVLFLTGTTDFVPNLFYFMSSACQCCHISPLLTHAALPYNPCFTANGENIAEYLHSLPRLGIIHTPYISLT